MDLVPVDDLYANLLASSLWSLGGRLGTASKEDLRASDATHADLLRAASEHGLGDLGAVAEIDPSLGGERLRKFLLSPEVRDIGAGLAVAHLATSSTLIDDLRKRFLATMTWYLASPEQHLREHALRLFDRIAADVSGSIERIVDTDRATLGIAMLAADAHAAAYAATSLFSRSDAPDFDEVFRFERRYRAALDARYGKIEPPNYEGSTIPVDRLYVEPRFAMPAHGETAILGADRVRGAIHRTVVLGNPGAGKSSFARTICHRLAAASDEDLQHFATPVLIELRDYAVQKDRSGSSIADHIATMVNASFQASPPSGAIEYLLVSGRAVVIFDGLDELTNTKARKEIRDDVEAFASLHPYTRILVTSRERGYWEAPLDDRRFTTCYITDFNDDQVSEYARKWFDLDKTLPQAQRRQRSDAFLVESGAVRDLRSNALMLALMCSIYKRQNHIPRNRAAVYEQCADMLFDRWDRSRQIDIDRPLDSHLHSVLQHVAHWIFEDQALQAGVTEQQLISHTAGYFEAEVDDDPRESRAMARDFVHFCHGRGWVLVASGTNEAGEELFEFAHRTFLEFFTAGWYAASDTSTPDLAGALANRVEQGEWEMVALLAVQLRNRTTRNSATQVLDVLVERAAFGNDAARVDNVLAFASRIYEFHVPRASTTRALARLVIDQHLRDRMSPDSSRYEYANEALRNLCTADAEARRAIFEGFEEVLRGEIARLDPSTVVVPVDAALNMRLAHFGAPKTELEARLADRIVDDFGESLRTIAQEDRGLAHVLQIADQVSVKEMLAWHGVEWAFAYYRHPAFPSVQTIPLSDSLLGRIVSSRSTRDENFERIEADGLALFEALAEASRPWATVPLSTPFWASNEGDPPQFRESLELPDRALAASAALLMVQLTSMERASRARVEALLGDGTNELAVLVTALRSGRPEPVSLELSEAERDILRVATSDPERLVSVVRPKHGFSLAG